jgi:Universal stress protein family
MTASDERDRYGEKLRQVEQAREDQWAAQRDRELLAKLRQEANERAAKDQQAAKTSKLFKRILCPMDFDDNSLKALNFASRLASENDAELYLLHVCSIVFVPLGGSVTDRDGTVGQAENRGGHSPTSPRTALPAPDYDR